jgi:hypothetical protein
MAFKIGREGKIQFFGLFSLDRKFKKEFFTITSAWLALQLKHHA